MRKPRIWRSLKPGWSIGIVGKSGIDGEMRLNSEIGLDGKRGMDGCVQWRTMSSDFFDKIVD